MSLINTKARLGWTRCTRTFMSRNTDEIFFNTFIVYENRQELEISTKIPLKTYREPLLIIVILKCGK